METTPTKRLEAARENLMIFMDLPKSVQDRLQSSRKETLEEWEAAVKESKSDGRN